MIRSLGDKVPQVHPSAWVSEAAYVVGDVVIGPEATIWPGAVIRAESPRLTIGRRTIIQERTVIHDVASIGEGCNIGHGLVIHCQTVGDHVLVGNKSALLDGATIGDYSVVAAMAVVAPRMEVPPHTIARGVPATLTPLAERWEKSLHEQGDYYVEWLDTLRLEELDLPPERLMREGPVIRTMLGKTPQIDPTAFVSEAAYVMGDVTIGPHASVWPGAVIRADEGPITIGAYTSVQDNAVVHGEGPMEIGERVTIAHGAMVHCTRVGNNVLIANNAVLLEFAEIGEFSIVAAAAVVRERTQVPPRSVVMGIPGEVVSTLDDERLRQRERQGEGYAGLAQVHKDAGLDARG